MGLINPVTLTAAAVATGAAAWYYWGESAKEAAAKAKAAAQEAEKDAKAAWSGVQLSTDEQIAILEGKIAGARGELDAALARRAAITRSTSAEEAQAIGAQVVERRKELEGLQRQIDQLQADDSKKRKSAAEKAERDYARALVETNRILDDIDPLHKANTEWQKLLDLQIKSKGAFTDEQMGQAYAKAMSGIEKQTEKTAAAMSKTWETFADNTQRTLSDVLYNGMNGKFNDIEDLFKQMLFRMAANAASARLTESLFGNSKDSGDKGLIGSVIKWLANANGNAFGNSGVYAFANGGTFSNGLYDRPTPFKFANGGGFSLGVMGEAGPEAVMPLARGSDGKLGVRAQGGGGQVIEYHDHTTNHYHIDSRSDRAQLMSDMSRLVDQKQAQFRERMKRGTV
jgi:phage-related minor tail protein